MQSINSSQAIKKLKDSKVIFLDVREPEEFFSEKLPKSINIPLSDFDEKLIAKAIPNKNTEIICFCRSGGRSSRAAQILEQLGYSKAFNLEGGLIALNQLLPKLKINLVIPVTKAFDA